MSATRNVLKKPILKRSKKTSALIFVPNNCSHDCRKLVYSLSILQSSLRTTAPEKREIQVAIEEVKQKINGYDQDISQITARIASRSRAAADLTAVEPLAPGGRRVNETERNHLIRGLT